MEHRYRTNIDIVLMVMAWGLELGKKEEVLWVLQRCVDEEWLYEMEFLLAKVQSSAGFLVDGDASNREEDALPLLPFIRWIDTSNRDERRVVALMGWDIIKDV
ncbi:hypothetical protein SUGI_0007640 [Cryptomeria japonica]|nr:hypothetical protein SUGI_0007640 [Cryptomeria japonica]